MTLPNNEKKHRMSASDESAPVVEPPPNSDAQDVTMRALEQRIRQQEILSELGVMALQGATFDQLLAETARLTAEGLRAEFCKIMEYVPSENCFLVRAGVGWGPGVVGVARVGADLASPAGFALRTGKPVISNHLENEERFRTPELLIQHGIRRAMNVILQGDRKAFGVLEVDSRSDDEFVAQDIAFLQGAANILGMAIERERYEKSLKAALGRHQILLKEMNHRVKNSLAMVSGMLRLQATADDDPELTHRLEEASARIAAIARAHERLYQGSDIENMDVGLYIEQVCRDSDEIVASCEITIEAQRGIAMAVNRAISVALIAVELITNAAKYAYQDKPGGKIWVRLDRTGDNEITLSVRDEGQGLPEDFDLLKTKSLGTRIISSFAKQLGATLSGKSRAPGTEFCLKVPLAAA